MKKLALSFLTFLIFAVSAFAQEDYNLEAAKQHLQIKQEKLRLSGGDLKNMSLASSYISPTTGWYHAYFNQTYLGIEVYNGILNVALKDGHVIHIANNFVPSLENRLNGFSNLKTIGAKDALIKTLENLQIPYGKAEGILQTNVRTNLKGEAIKYNFQSKNVSSEPIEVKLYWYPYETKVKGKLAEKIALSWRVNLTTQDKKSNWSVQVDANTGAILEKIDNVIKCDFGHNHATEEGSESCEKSVITNKNIAGANSYNVFAYPLESPIHGNRTVVVSPYTSVVSLGTGPGTTNGWHENGTTIYTDTRGNNVFAQEDTNDDDAGGNRPNPSNYDFDYPYTLGLGTAAANQNAAITNLFFWSNFIHDVLWKFGFDEPSGNFQTNNMGRGGLGNDFVYADAQDGSGTNNANFLTPPDGSSPRMQMFIFDLPSNYLADSDFDNAIISHEYGHGWSIRLTGGPSNTSCLNNAEQGGEGWSDYLGLMLTTNWASLSPNLTSANTPRGIGTYVLGQSTTTGAGIRPFRYSYDMANINPLVTYAGVSNSTTFSQPHGIGSIWCTMLWDMTWEIILQDNAIEPNVYNTSNMIGNVAALKLVNEGLRLQPCSPSFVDARDAILAADQALFAGKYRCAISKAFSRRGLGLNASTGSSTNDRTVTEDFTPISGNALVASSPITICSGSLLQYTATSNVAGTTFLWSRATVAGISNASASSNNGIISETLINTTSSPVTVNYVFSLSPNGCGLPGSVQQTLKVIVNPAAITPLVATYSVCQNSTVPSGQGLVMPAPSGSSVISNVLEVGPTFARPTLSSTSYYYKSLTFVATASGSVTFDITDGDFDTFLFLYENSFNPASPSANLIASNDDKDWDNLLSRITFNLVQGRTYYLVVSSYWSLDTGNFTMTATQPGFVNTYNWYTASSDGNPIFQGNVFNPVGVAGSGIASTAMPITKNYFVALERNPTCRATTTFSVSEPASTQANATVRGSDTVCAIFNNGVLTLNDHTGSILGWEVSENNFETWTPITTNSVTLNYSGLMTSKQYRAVFGSVGQGCQITKSKPAKINVISPIQNLVNPISGDTALNKVSLTITSAQKINPNSKIYYEAGRNIVLKEGFEATNGSTFKAEIVTNECFIPVTLTLQPAEAEAKDVDVSNLFPDTPFPSNKYLIPFAWSQFGTQEVRRSLLKFDLSSIPANAVIDSAFLSLSFSQKLLDENPPFTGHFGANAFEVKRILADWSATTTTWNNQPTTTNTNTVTVPVAITQTQDYPKINIKNLVIDQVANANHGLMIKYPTETPYKITCIASSEEAIAAKRPKLVVYYRYK